MLVRFNWVYLPSIDTLLTYCRTRRNTPSMYTLLQSQVFPHAGTRLLKGRHLSYYVPSSSLPSSICTTSTPRASRTSLLVWPQCLHHLQHQRPSTQRPAPRGPTSSTFCNQHSNARRKSEPHSLHALADSPPLSMPSKSPLVKQNATEDAYISTCPRASRSRSSVSIAPMG